MKLQLVIERRVRVEVKPPKKRDYPTPAQVRAALTKEPGDSAA